jgi:protoheme IX farnesyltransferase
MNRFANETAVALPVPVAAMEDAPGLFADLMILMKARLTLLVLVTSLVGFCVASGERLDWVLLFHVMLGTALVAASSQVFNQVIEARVDRLMERTMNRPLPAGRMTRATAAAFGGALGVAGLLYLAVFTNRHCTALAAATVFVYLALYTPLKRLTPLCIPVGAVAGAIPPVIGWAAVRPPVDAGAWILFGILFAWQMPHFLAIAWMYRDEYRRAGFVMLRPRDGSGLLTALESLAHTLLLVVLTLLLVTSGYASKAYLVPAMAANALLLYCAANFLRERSRLVARKLFFASILYLPVLLGLLVFARV